jgi:hypothetical protein
MCVFSTSYPPFASDIADGGGTLDISGKLKPYYYCWENWVRRMIFSVAIYNYYYNTASTIVKENINSETHAAYVALAEERA